MTDLTTQNPVDSTQPAPPVGQTVASPSSPQAVTAAGQGQPAPVPGARPTEVRPAWIPEPFWDAAKGAPKEKEFSEHLASLEKLKTDWETARGAVPSKPEDYKPDLGEVKLPEGRELDTKDPRFSGLQKIAHESGMSQDTFSKLLQMEARAVVDAQAESFKRVEADKNLRLEMLGENGASRLEALEKWVDTQWPKPEEATQIKATLWTPLIVEVLEQVQQVLTKQGVHGFTQLGRESSGRNELPDGFEKWTSLDKRTYQLNQLAQRNGQTP